MELLQRLGITALNAGACYGSQWSSTQDAGLLTSFNPANGEAIAQVYNANQQDYDTILQQSVQAAEAWRQVPAPKRGDVIREMGNLLREYKDELGSLVSLENGKIKQEGDGEIQEMIDIADFAVGQSRMLYGKTMHSEREQHRMMEQWHPLGVVGIISAFNFPAAVWSWNAFIAAIAGNSCIWFPSPKTPLTAIAITRLCQQVLDKHQLPPIFTLCIHETPQLAQQMVDDKRVALVSFTGATETGREVSQRVAKRLGKCLLELGGNNALIIDETADLELALPATVFGAVGTAGQRCTTTRRLFIHESIYKDVVSRLQHAYEQVVIGDPLQAGTLMGPLIDEAAIKHYEQALEQVRSLGGDVLYGGEVLPRPGHYVQPALVAAQADWSIVKQETFAPILYVMSFSELEQALAWQNDVPQGLSSALFTRQVSHAERFLSAIGSDCGIANINIGTSGAEIGGAFGGEKDTGGGREAGSDAWQAYMRRQTNTINWGDELPLAQGITFNL